MLTLGDAVSNYRRDCIKKHRDPDTERYKDSIIQDLVPVEYREGIYSGNVDCFQVVLDAEMVESFNRYYEERYW